MLTGLTNLRDAAKSLKDLALKNYKGAGEAGDFDKEDRYDNLVFHLELAQTVLDTAIEEWEADDEFKGGL
jgi:hypothetical protein